MMGNKAPRLVGSKMNGRQGSQDCKVSPGGTVGKTSAVC